MLDIILDTLCDLLVQYYFRFNKKDEEKGRHRRTEYEISTSSGGFGKESLDMCKYLIHQYIVPPITDNGRIPDLSSRANNLYHELYKRFKDILLDHINDEEATLSKVNLYKRFCNTVLHSIDFRYPDETHKFFTECYNTEEDYRTII